MKKRLSKKTLISVCTLIAALIIWTTIKEFSYNYYIPKESGCSWSEDERYCVLVKWEDFKNDPETYIDNAFNKRKSEISKKTKVRP